MFTMRFRKSTPSQAVLARLRANPAFAAYSARDLIELDRYCTLVTIPPGAWLLTPGRRPLECFVVESGLIELRRYGTVIGLASRGCWVGLFDPAHPEPTDVEAQAIDVVDVYAFSRRELDAVRRLVPSIDPWPTSCPDAMPGHMLPSAFEGVVMPSQPAVDNH